MIFQPDRAVWPADNIEIRAAVKQKDSFTAALF